MKTIGRVDSLRYKGRPQKKAFIGAIIGAVTAIGGGIAKGIAERKARKRQERADAEQQARENAMNLTKAYANNDSAQEELENRFKPEFKAGGSIHIAPSKRGTFTAAATKHGMGVQSFASKVLSNKEDYSPAMVKKANFARNASKWKHRFGGTDKLRCGGKKKYAVGGVKPVISEGGQAERIDDRTFLLRGRKHETGGIVIGQGRKSIEAEDGEVLRLGKGNIKILSAQPILNGESPAEKTIKNPNKAEMAFQQQEAYKDRNNLNDDGTKKRSNKNNRSVMENKTISSDSNSDNVFAYGGSKRFGNNRRMGITLSERAKPRGLTKNNRINTPVGKGYVRKRADFGAVMSGVATGMNIASPIISGVTGLIQANKLKKPQSPTLYGAAKLKTSYDISPQLGALERSRQRLTRQVDRDTASSAAALSRKQSIDTGTTEQQNILYGQKENIETELINKDRLNAQNQADKNVATINQYKDQLSDFYNTKIGIRNESINSIVGGIQSGLNDMQTRNDAKKAQQQEEAILIGGDVNNSIPRLIASGYEFDEKTLRSYYNMPGLNPEVKELIGQKLGINTVKRGRLSTPSTLPKH